MNVAPRLVAGPALLVLATASAAQTFVYPDFASVATLARNGSAAQAGTALRLVNNTVGHTGSAWHATPMRVTEGFETQFTFVMSSAPEGMAFVVQDSPAGSLALGGGLWGLGYGYGVASGPISKSLAIEIDAVQQGFLDDTSANELSVHTVGALGNSENEGVSIGRVTPAVDLSNTQVHTLRIRYVPGVIEVYLGAAATPILSTPFTFEDGGTQLTGGSTGGLGLSGPTAWVGFTAANPAAGTHFVEIRSWTWTSYSLPDPCYVGNVHAGSGGPYDLLTIDGTTGGFFRVVQKAFADPFTVDVAPPPGETTAAFLLFATIGIANETTVTATPYGTSCFPLVFPIDLGGAGAPVVVPVPPGIFLPAEMTFQAVMATESANPNTLELTNAIALQFAPGVPPTISGVAPNSALPGGTITITGSNFSPYATVEVGGVAATVLSSAPTQLTFAMPAAVPCDTTLRVVHPDGADAQRTFNPTPSITSQINTSGPSSGGTNYIVLGQGFAPGTTVTIGGNPATISTISATVLVAITPPGTPGPAPILITTPGGCSVSSTFTYL